MARRPRPIPLFSLIAFGFGALAGLMVGGYEPSWGVALAFPGLTLILSYGVVREPDLDDLAAFLTVTLALMGGLLLGSAGASWVELDTIAELETAERAEELRDRLIRYWLVMASALPLGALALYLRRRKLSASGPPKGRAPERSA